MTETNREARASRTLSRHLAPAHHYLRRRIPAYQRWHTQPYTHHLHWFVLLLAVFFQLLFIRQTVLGAGSGGDQGGGNPILPSLAVVTAPTNGTFYRAATLPMIVGQAADDLTGLGLAENSTTFTLQRTSDDLFWTGSVWGLATDLATAHPAVTGGQIAGWTAATPLPPWLDGSYRLVTKTMNLGGQMLLSAPVVFTYDQTSPTAPSFVIDGSDTADDVFTNATNQLEVNWSAASDATAGVARYQYAVGTTSGGSDSVAWTDATLAVSATIPTPALVSGRTYFVAVRAVDQAGNIGPATSANGLTVDHVPPDLPSVSFTSPAADQTPTLQWSAPSDFSGVSTVTVRIGTAPGAADSLLTNLSGATTSYTLATPLAAGTYYVTLGLTDGAGNSNLSSSTQLIVQSPSLAVVTPTPTPSLTPTPTPTLSSSPTPSPTPTPTPTPTTPSPSTAAPTVLPDSVVTMEATTEPASGRDDPLTTPPPLPRAAASPLVTVLPEPTREFIAPAAEPVPLPVATSLTAVAGDRRVGEGLAVLFAIRSLPEVEMFTRVIHGATVAVLGLGFLITPLFNVSVLFPLDRWLAFIFPPAWRRRRRPWGKVIDAESAHPIPLAKITLITTREQKPIETMTTDAEGYFGWPAHPGTYRLQVMKEGYTFPSQLTRAQYHGEVVSTRSPGRRELLIPLDPDHQRLQTQLLVLVVARTGVEALRRPLLLVGSLLAFVSFLDTQTLVSGLILAMYGLVWAEFDFERRLYRLVRGRVIARATHHPLPWTILRFVNQVTGKLTMTSVTNRSGEFTVRVPPGYYQVRLMKPGFAQLILEEVVPGSGGQSPTYQLRPSSEQGIEL